VDCDDPIGSVGRCGGDEISESECSGLGRFGVFGDFAVPIVAVCSGNRLGSLSSSSSLTSTGAPDENLLPMDSHDVAAFFDAGCCCGSEIPHTAHRSLYTSTLL
jgi:hypothetical protein